MFVGTSGRSVVGSRVEPLEGRLCLSAAEPVVFGPADTTGVCRDGEGIAVGDVNGDGAADVVLVENAGPKTKGDSRITVIPGGGGARAGPRPARTSSPTSWRPGSPTSAATAGST